MRFSSRLYYSSLIIRNMEAVEVKSAEWISTSGSSEVDDECGDPQVLPRVGDQYQAKIPSLIAAPDLSQLTKKLMDSEVSAYPPESLSMGLPIPLIWAYCKLEGSDGTLESVKNEESQVISQNECVELKVEPLLLGEGKNVEGLQNCASAFNCDEMYIGSYPLLKSELNKVRVMYLLPSSMDEPWSDIEYNSFLLGLYIFGKNLNVVKKFVGSKTMGDILSFYYGKFYRSDRYRRWSECRRLRTRRCIYGQKIFTGRRHQELFSRLFSGTTEECQNMLTELSRAFGVGKVTFEEYVLALRDAVGFDRLIDAVSIGKGKQDLTGNAVEPVKTSHTFSVRPEMPMGKACSSLTCDDIIKFLTGDFRLSKARSNDLFWEAVWPRLLAKGWHSEQPKDYAGFGSKQPLVFLIPGVKKFSRRLMKGNHYFDSVSDVLNKVASEPVLIKIEVPASEGNANREDRQDKQGLDGVLRKQQCCYLQPRSSSCTQNLMKFTIVDTSMANGMEQRKVRELTSFPLETMNTSFLSSHSSESEQDTSEESEDEAEKTNTSNPVEESSDWMSMDSLDCIDIPEALNATTKEAVKNHKRHSDSDLLNDELPEKSNKHQFIQKVKSGCSQHFPPVMKKHKSTACNDEELFQFTESTFIDSKLDLNVSTSFSNEGIAIENQEGGEDVSAEKTETRMLIELNLPHIELGTEMDRPQQINNDQCANTPSCSNEEIKFNEIHEFPDGQIQQQPTNVIRRQSRRNRPLTTKAVEALEYSFLNTKWKRKNIDSSNSQSLSSTPYVTATFDKNR